MSNRMQKRLNFMKQHALPSMLNDFDVVYAPRKSIEYLVGKAEDCRCPSCRRFLRDWKSGWVFHPDVYDSRCNLGMDLRDDHIELFSGTEGKDWRRR